MKNIELSIVVPVKDEAENVIVLAREIETAMAELEMNWELLWIDDGSTDGTRRLLEELAGSSEGRHRVFLHERCFGQSAAMATGFRQARGQIVATLDGDGQNDPAGIPGLVRKLIAEKADVVNGWRKKRQDNLIRKISSKLANGFRNILTGEQIRDVGCALRVMRKECVVELPVFKGMHRFLPTLIRIAGYRNILEMPVNHRSRIRGKTKYGVWNRLWVGIADTFAVCWMKSRMVYPKLMGKDGMKHKNGRADDI